MSLTPNPAQREAIHYLDGPLLVLAGAGSGKTRVITQKIAHLIDTCGFSPQNIAAITFTNKAAREMKERVGKQLDARAEGLLCCTFHALGVRILREDARTLGYKPGFSIFDSDDCYGIVSDLAGSVDKAVIRRLQWQISAWKNAGLTPDAAAGLAGNDLEQRAAAAFRNYAATLKAYQAVDFDDLIGLPLTLFEEHPVVREKWQNRLRYLLVDEYQDTNVCQYRLLKHLTGVRAQFTAVGDDDQAIYGWRGADIENLNNLTRDFPALKVVKLEQNYRSTVRILQAANTLIANNPKLFEKKLWSDLGHGAHITVNPCKEPEHEAETVIMKLQAHRFEHRTRWADYAILYRGNYQARVFEQQLRNARIPYALSGGQSFFDKAEIRDLVAYLRLIANPDDDPAFIRAITTPRRGIGGQTLEALGSYAGERHRSLYDAAHETGFAARVGPRQVESIQQFCDFIGRIAGRANRDPASAVVPELLTAIGYERWLHDHNDPKVAAQKWANVREFADWLMSKGDEDKKSLLEMTQTLALINMLERQQDGAEVDAVKLSTLHAAKGLEYPHVFLVGAEEGLLPHRESMAPDKVQEERRLMYVGITRARRSLHLSYCQRRSVGREWFACDPSRFIAEMGENAVQAPSKKVVDRATSSDRLAAMRAMLGEGKKS
jgi:ATP-dependent DNA helicase Rep